MLQTSNLKTITKSTSKENLVFKAHLFKRAIEIVLIFKFLKAGMNFLKNREKQLPDNFQNIKKTDPS